MFFVGSINMSFHCGRVLGGWRVGSGERVVGCWWVGGWGGGGGGEQFTSFVHNRSQGPGMLTAMHLLLQHMWSRAFVMLHYRLPLDTCYCVLF